MRIFSTGRILCLGGQGMASPTTHTYHNSPSFTSSLQTKTKLHKTNFKRIEWKHKRTPYERVLKEKEAHRVQSMLSAHQLTSPGRELPGTRPRPGDGTYEWDTMAEPPGGGRVDRGTQKPQYRQGRTLSKETAWRTLRVPCRAQSSLSGGVEQCPTGNYS